MCVVTLLMPLSVQKLAKWVSAGENSKINGELQGHVRTLITVGPPCRDECGQTH